MTAPPTVNIQKGGALLGDVRRLVEEWDLEARPADNLRRVADDNLLAKETRRRLDDILLRILTPRFVEPGPQVIASLKRLLHDQRAFVEAVYYETSRDEVVLAAFAEGPLYDWHGAGRVGVTIEDTVGWIADEASEGRMPAWSPIVRTKVARGILATLRDCAVLEGSVKKRFRSPDLTLRGFAYVAYRLHEQGASSTGIVTSCAWRRWLLTAERVHDLLAAADRANVLSFAAAGSAFRIDWQVDRLEDAIDVAA